MDSLTPKLYLWKISRRNSVGKTKIQGGGCNNPPLAANVNWNSLAVRGLISDGWLGLYISFEDWTNALECSQSPCILETGHILFLTYFRIAYSLMATRCSPEWDCVALMLTVSHPSPLASWYQFYCLVNRDTRALVACPELLVRKLVESGIEPATLRSTGRNLNHTTNIYPVLQSVA